MAVGFYLCMSVGLCVCLSLGVKINLIHSLFHPPYPTYIVLSLSV